MSAPDSLHEADLRLLLAVDEAADDEGWATPSEIRFRVDGTAAGSGRWARTLYQHETHGYLEKRPVGGNSFLWGLTAKGGDALVEPGKDTP